MTSQTPGQLDLGFRPGDHVCAFYNGDGNVLDNVVADFLSKGLQAGDKCLCFIDAPSPVRERIPGELVPRDGILQFFTEEEGYLDGGRFSADSFIRNLESTVQGVLSEGYERLWLAGDTSVIIRSGISQQDWFAAESQVSEFAPRYPQVIMCLYDLDLFDGQMVMYVLRTHTQIFVNGLIIANPYYVPKRQFLGGR